MQFTVYQGDSVHLFVDEEQLDVSDAGFIQQRGTLNNMTV